MSDRKYYAERMGKQYNLDDLKKAFIIVYNKLKEKKYFNQAEGYTKYIVEGLLYKNDGLWGKDISDFIFLETRIENAYPFKDSIKKWDETILFTIIEFLYDYVSVEYDSGYGTHTYDERPAKLEYRANINKILSIYKNGYELKENGEICEKPPSGLENIVNIEIKTHDPKNIDEIIKQAKNKFFKYGSSLNDKKEAVRNLGDVLEYLKRQNIKLPSKDDSDLFRIINNFDIRHHNQEQQGEYDKEISYDWMFYTFLSSIYYFLKLNDRYIAPAQKKEIE